MSATPPDIWTPIPVPKQAAAREGTANIGPVRLWYWDTGGRGEAVVLTHAAAQGSDCWKYQQPALVRAGYRVIGWSQRGAFRSERGPEDAPGTAAGDLAKLLDTLKIETCHLVGSAEGAAVITHFALENPGRVRSLTLAGARLDVAEDDYRGMDKRTRLPANHNTALTFADIGPSYRGGNAAGTKAWAEMASAAHPVGKPLVQPAGAQPLSWTRVRTISVPVMLLTGDADHYSSAAQNRLVAQYLINRELAVIDEAGTAAYWEQPDAFNGVLLDFLGRHRGGKSVPPPAAVPPRQPWRTPTSSRAPVPPITAGPVTIWNKVPVPTQVPARAGWADTSPVRIWHWDTGGDGEAIVFCHPWSQSSECWAYQQPFFAKAGYRVIAWSQRGFFKTEKGPADDPGSAAGDLHKLLDYLKVDKAHIVGCAAGGCTAIAYAIAHPERLHSVVVSGSILLPSEPDYEQFMANLGRGPAGPGRTNVPVEFGEVGASYRAGNPEGLATWQMLEHLAHPNGWQTSQPWGADRNWKTFGAMTLPILLQTGDTDMGPSPALQRLFSSKFPNWQLRVIEEAGHAAYWEQPEAFNASVLDFISRHGRKKG